MEVKTGNIVYLGIGSSLGDRLKNLQNALQQLTEKGDITIERVSPVYESPHLGKAPEDAYRYPPHLNAVVKTRTGLSPEALLCRILQVEQTGGRQRNISWGPRTIDIDILLYGNLEVQTEHLRVPHPEMEKRAFVMVPLCDIAANLVLPNGRLVCEVAKDSSIRQQPIWRYKGALKVHDTGE